MTLLLKNYLDISGRSSNNRPFQMTLPGATDSDHEDNAPMESFFNSLKNEQVFHEDYETRAQAKQDVFEYIEAFYNRSRRHSAFGYCSPAQHYAAWIEQQKLAA